MENDLRSLELYRWNIVAISSISILPLSLSLSPPLPPLSSRLDGVRVETRIREPPLSFIRGEGGDDLHISACV